MVISVTQYNNFIKALLDNEPILAKVSVTGEVSNYHDNGESIFFTLKDAFSQMECFAYKNCAKPLYNGCLVVVEGRPAYLKSGKISFTVTAMNMCNADGEQYLKFIQLKNKLDKLGYFDISIKKSLPKYVFNIGVVSSNTGAVIHDICNVLKRRNKYAAVNLFSVKVQGENAAEQIAAGIKYFDSSDVDVIIVARGGGSAEDLSAFNTEIVATAVYTCKKPVVSAVGHETDFTICDYCADLRASTPSVAAEIVSANNPTDDFKSTLDDLIFALNFKFSRCKNKLGSITDRLYILSKNKLQDAKSAIKFGVKNAEFSMSKKIYCADNSLRVLAQKLEFCSPQKAFKGGKSLIYKDGKKVVDRAQVNKGDELTIYNDGFVIEAIVKEVKNGF